ncbi:helix-turn-helix transcriptional regulator [Pseudovibrio sp. WM33]|uniref:helix-turn-helix transcriptional regulator n=1 Tax=Pseudovibrio sp. WM33 TaxID=1735585 RepID=UPI0007AE9F97|nr:helix-turn-helix transcriptional regulator [Pseudovibrio sp. WM33]KZL26064.1 Helix-turn-helix domain protein [Pseudovibrio sp. WM33]
MKPSERLKQARKAAGYKKATEAAHSMGINRVTYIAHENGNRGIGPEAAQKYANAFSVSAEWLLYGTEPTQANSPKPGSPDTAELVKTLLTNSTRPESNKLDRGLFLRSLEEAQKLESSLLGGYGSIEDLMTLTETIYKVALKRKEDTPTE